MHTNINLATHNWNKAIAIKRKHDLSAGKINETESGKVAETGNSAESFKDKCHLFSFNPPPNNLFLGLNYN